MLNIGISLKFSPISKDLHLIYLKQMDKIHWEKNQNLEWDWGTLTPSHKITNLPHEPISYMWLITPFNFSPVHDTYNVIGTPHIVKSLKKLKLENFN
jgi:hypothetical protein